MDVLLTVYILTFYAVVDYTTAINSNCKISIPFKVQTFKRKKIRLKKIDGRIQRSSMNFFLKLEKLYSKMSSYAMSAKLLEAGTILFLVHVVLSHVRYVI